MAVGQETIPFLELSRGLARRIDEALARYATYGPDCPPLLAEAIRHSLLAPGKRLRPMLVLMACRACGCDDGAAMPAACAVEMVHTYSLIHDDLPAMDDDDLRRGRPSCHAKFGEATAILAGDALLAQAFEVLATGIEPPEVAARCCGELAVAAGASNLVGGQEDDLKAESGDFSLEQLQRIHRRKTGAMICVSLRLGGLIAQASDEQLAALTVFGEKLGLAFQVVDDLLDLAGDAHSLGKRTGKDAGRGKLTFPGLLGVDRSREFARRLIDEAHDSLETFGSGAAPLAGLANFVLQRNR
jgi:geranylgeranyl diphosphate synthase type II